jgi:3-phenylpropionate/trans-cinnamate dioxygenase ferredoxin reductase subunit
VADRSVDFLLIGGGVAAAACAETLRGEGASGSILVAGREAHPPYERPPLSKEYLAGRAEATSREVEGVELATRTSVMKLDAEERVAKLSTKEEVSFGKALIATGANVRRLRVDGAGLEGIHYLRTFENADAIREDAQSAEHVVLIGGSYIACELAATLSGLGCRCSMLMLEEFTLERHFGRAVGEWAMAQLAERGVGIHGTDELDRFEGSGERVERVVSKGGLTLEAQCVVLGTGVTPDVMVAQRAGLEIGETGGVKCSSRLETTAPGIYAAGDVAEWDSPLHGRRARVEHHEVAVAQGRTAARNMLGADVAHEEVPYFWSDLGDWATLEYVGVDTPGDPVIRGSLDDGSFSAYYLADDGRLVGALVVNRPGDLDEARELIAARATPSADELRAP